MPDAAPDAQQISSIQTPPVSGVAASVKSDVSNNNSTLTAPQSTVASTDQDEDDPNPRSPKRPRLSPPTLSGNIDIAAAAERALAESLNINLSAFGTESEQAPTQQDAPPRPQPVLGGPPHLGMPTRQMLLDNVPQLETAANQILNFLGKLNQAEIGAMLFGPPSARGQEYRLLKANLDQTKRMYLTGLPFISYKVHAMHGSGQIDTIRKANLATFMASIFSGELGLRVMDMSFIDVFVPDGGKLLKAQASIYLELKTQAFVAAAKTAPAMLNQVMIDLFPPDVEQQLLRKRPGSKQLAPSEQDFLTRLYSRRDILRSLVRDNKLANVHETYSWNAFAKEVSTYLTKHMDSLAAGEKERSDVNSPEVMAQLQQDELENQFHMQEKAENDGSLETPAIPPLPSMSANGFTLDDLVSQAARATEIALGDVDSSFFGPAIPSLPPSRPAPTAISTTTTTTNDPASTTQFTTKPSAQISSEFQHYDPAALLAQPAEEDQGDSERGVPHTSQTAPTQVLYERARQVSSSASPSGRKPVAPSQRRPWTTEEENALMTGIDEVKGPHWSQILAMYGPGGTVSEALKDRNQVQLKDKARNLKLFFLKAGIEAPYYLQAVTGDLKTRAPSQAEKLDREKGVGDGSDANTGNLDQDGQVIGDD